MFRPAPGVRVFLAPGSTDLRKQIDGLAMVAEQQLARDPYSGHLFPDYSPCAERTSTQRTMFLFPASQRP